MPTLLVLLLSPLLCQGASLPDQPGCSDEEAACAALGSTIELLKAASTSLQCPDKASSKAEAEQACVAYVASVLRLCRAVFTHTHTHQGAHTPHTHTHQWACVEEAYRASHGPAACSSVEDLCTASASFARSTATTFALTCTDADADDREGRFFLQKIGALAVKIFTGLTVARTVGTLPSKPVRVVRPSCTWSNSGSRLPCIFPFHQGDLGVLEPVAGQPPTAKVYDSCTTDSIVAATIPLPGGASTTVPGLPAGVAALGLDGAPSWCATSVDAAAATGAQPRGSSIRGAPVPADRMLRWRYCGRGVCV